MNMTRCVYRRSEMPAKLHVALDGVLKDLAVCLLACHWLKLVVCTVIFFFKELERGAPFAMHGAKGSR